MARTFREQYDQSKRDRLQLVKAWDLSSQYLKSKQYLRWDKDKLKWLQQETVDARRNRVTQNFLLGIYRNVLARFSTVTPSLAVMPRTPAHDDILKALANEMVCRSHHDREQIDKKLAKGARHLLRTGTMALRAYWDPGAGKTRSCVHSANDLFAEPKCTDWEESAWVAVRRFEDRQTLLDDYADKADVISEAAEARKDEREQELSEDRLEVLDVYWRRDGKHEVRLVGVEEPLFVTEVPGKRVPVQIARFTTVDDELYGLGLLFALIDSQAQYNKLRSKLFDGIDLMVNPGWWIPHNSRVDLSVRTDYPGWKQHYNAAGGKPEPASLNLNFGQLFEMLRLIQSEMLDIAGVHAPAMGKTARGLDSGEAIKAIVAQDVSHLQITQDEIEACLQEHYRDVLGYEQTYRTEDQMVRAHDYAGKIVYRTVRATDLYDEPEIVLEAGTLFRDHVEDREKKMLDLWDRKLVQDPQEVLSGLSFRTGQVQAVRKMAAIAHAKDLLEAAKRVGQGMIAGVEIFPTDDVTAIKDVFGEFIQTPEFYELAPGAQQYVRDVLIRCWMPNAPIEEFGAAANQKIWPLQPTDPAQAQQAAIATAEPLAGAQAHQEAQANMERQQAAQMADPRTMAPRLA